MPILDEQKAFQVMQLAPSLEGEEREKAKTLLTEYKAAREAAGETLFPQMERQRIERQKSVRTMFQDRDTHGFDEETLGEMRDVFKHQPEGKTRFLNSQFLAQELNTSTDQIDSGYEAARDAYSSKVFGVEGMDDGAFYARVGERFDREDDALKRAQENGLRGISGVEGFPNWKNLQEGDMSPVEEKALYENYQKIAAATSQRVAPYRETITGTVTALQEKTGVVEGESPSASWGELTESILAIPEKDRDLVLSAIIANAGDGEAKGVAQKLGENFARGARDLGMGAFDNPNRDALLRARRALSSDKFETAAGMDALQSALRQSSAQLAPEAAGAIYRTQGETVAATEEERGEAIKAIDTQLAAMSLNRKIRQIADEDIDPAKGEWMVTQGLYDAARSVPYMAASVTGVAGFMVTSSALADDSFYRLKEANPELTDDQAAGIATVGGFIQTGFERFGTKGMFGGLPAVNRFYNKVIGGTLGSVVARGATRAVGGTLVEMAQENAQDFTPFVLQSALAALDEDLPDANLKERWGESMNTEAQGKLFFATLPLTLIGAGAATYSDVKNAAPLFRDTDALRATGVSVETAREVREAWDSGDKAGAQAKIREAHKNEKVDQKEIATVRREAIQKLEEERRSITLSTETLEDAGKLPAMRRNDSGYQIRFNDGTETGFDTFEEADAARWQWAEENNLKLHEATRSAIAQVERNLEAGREIAYEFVPQEMTGRRAVEEGIATEEQLLARADIADSVGSDTLQASGADIEYATAAAEINVTSREGFDRLAGLQILGLNQSEFVEGVQRTTVKLFQGATPLTVIEEKLESDASRIISKEGGREWLEEALREYQETTGDKLFAKDYGLTDSDLREAYSHLGQSYFVGRSNKSNPDIASGWQKKGFRNWTAQILQGKLGAAYQGYTSFFRAVWKRSAIVEKFRREGALDSALESELSKSLGLSESYAENVRTMETAQELKDSLLNEGEKVDTDDTSVDTDDTSASNAKVDTDDTRTVPQGSIPATLEVDESAPFSLIENPQGAISSMFDPFHRSPELRIRLMSEMQKRAKKEGQRFAPILAANRTKKSIDDERKQRVKELEASGATLSEARKEARKIADEQLEAKELIGTDKETLIAGVRMLNSITSAVPPEVRGRIGGYLQLAQATTPRKILAIIEDRIQRIDTVLESHLRKEADKELKKLFKKATPTKGKAGEKPKGKAGADVHDLFNVLKEAVNWSAKEKENYATALEVEIAQGVSKGEMTSDQEAHAKLEMNLVRLFGDWNATRNSTGADAERRFEALKAGRRVWDEGYGEYQAKLAALREMHAARRDGLREATGKAGSDDELDIEKEIKDSPKGIVRDIARNLISFDQSVFSIFGKDSAEAKEITDRQRMAENQFEDAIFEAESKLSDLFEELGGGKRLAGELKALEMKKRSIKAEAADGKARVMSPLEAISALLMWRQEDGKRHMEGKKDEDGKVVSDWHYDQGFIDQISEQFTPDAWRVFNFISDQYAQEYESLNEVFKELNGINLPKNEFYAPLLVKAQQIMAGQIEDPLTGFSIAQGSSTPGALRSRGSAIAKPDFKDALEVWQAHTKQMEHFKAYAIFSRDAQAIIGNTQVRDSITASKGKEALDTLDSYVRAFAQGGVHQAGAHRSFNRFMGELLSNAAQVALLGRFSTLAVQSTQLLAASTQMPAGAYLSRMGKLFTGQLGWGDSIKSDYIQRRLRQQPAAVQILMEGLRAGKPNEIKEISRKLGQLLSGADAAFTAGTFAIVLDYQKTKGREMGLSGSELESYALAEAERVTDLVAQPTKKSTRSILELEQNSAFMRAAWSFQSENRKNLGLAIAMHNYGSVNDQAKVMTFLAASSFFGYVVKATLSDLEDKEDDELFDERHWNPKRLLLTMGTDWMGAMPILGDTIQSTIFTASGEFTYSGNMLSSIERSPGAIERLATLEWDNFVKDFEAVMSAMGVFHKTSAGVASISHIVRDALEMAGIID